MKTIKKKNKYNKKTIKKRNKHFLATRYLKKSKKSKKTIKIIGGVKGVSIGFPVTEGMTTSSTAQALPNSVSNQVPVGPDPILRQAPELSIGERVQTRDISRPNLENVPLNQLQPGVAPTTGWQHTTFNRIIGTATAVIGGAIALGLGPAAIFGTTLTTYIAQDIYNENPVGVTLTAITPVAQVLYRTGVYSAEQINDAVNNDILPRVTNDPNIGHFDITQQNGYNRVGTTDIHDGTVITNPGFVETLGSIAHNFMGIAPVHTYPNFMHERQQPQGQPNVGLSPPMGMPPHSEGPGGYMSMPTILTYGESIQDFISIRVGGQTAELLTEVYENLSEPVNMEQQLLNANRASAQAAREALLGRQQLREERAQININEFNERGQTIIDALNRLEDRKIEEQQRVNEYNQNIAGPRIRATLSHAQREQEAENVSTIAQILIDQAYYDAMPEFNNPETPIEEQYDPRYGEAYVNNLERIIEQGLSVRRTPNYNADNIGDTSALVLASSLITRSIIGFVFRKGKKNKTKKNRKNKLERTPQEIRKEIKIEHDIDLPEPEYVTLPPIREPREDIYSVPVSPITSVNEYYSTPSWGDYFLRPYEEYYHPYSENISPTFQGEYDEYQYETPGTIIREYVEEDKEREKHKIEELKSDKYHGEDEQDHGQDEEFKSEDYEEDYEEENKVKYNICEKLKDFDDEIESKMDIFKYFIKTICRAYDDEIPDKVVTLIKIYNKNLDILPPELLLSIVNNVHELMSSGNTGDSEESLYFIREFLEGNFDLINQYIRDNNGEDDEDLIYHRELYDTGIGESSSYRNTQSTSQNISEIIQYTR